MPAQSGALPPGSRRLATIGFMIATAMQAADATIVNVALPRIEAELGGDIEAGSWVVTGYLCAAAVVAPLTGTFYRRYGARTVFAAAIATFVVASLLCGGAPSMPALILLRVVQGAAGGILQPVAQATLLDIHPRQDHGRIQAIWGATIMVGPVLGPMLGGVITDLASWRWIFAINLPIGILAFWALRSLPPLAEGAIGRSGVDLPGLALVVVAVGATQLCLQRGIGRDWQGSPELILEAGAAAAAAAAIAVVHARSRFRLFSFTVFRNLNFTVANFYNFFISVLLYVTVIFLPALSEGPFGYGATVTGITVSPRGVAMVVMMVWIGQLMAKVDHRLLLGLGLVVMAAGLAMLSAPVAGGALWLGIATAVQGMGAGMLFAPMSTLAFATLAAPLRADAAGVYILLRQLGGAAGIAVMTAVLQLWTRSSLAGLAARPDLAGATPQRLTELARLSAYTGCFRAMAVLTVALIPGVLLFRVGRPTAADRDLNRSEPSPSAATAEPD